MKYVNESLFLSTLRSFFSSLFAVFGALIGLFLFFLMVSLAFAGKNPEGSNLPNKATILPDAQGSRKKLSKTAPVILQIDIDDAIGSEEISSEKIEKILLQSTEEGLKGRVKGILLHINSPGGDAFDTNVIYTLIRVYKERYQIPVHAFVRGIAASGSYYIACAADHISCSEVSIIGSVGVLSWPPFFNVKDLVEKWGIKTLTLTAGAEKDAMNPFEEWNEKAVAHRQELIDFFYENFTSIVTQNRPQISEQRLIKEFGARVFPPEQALAYGYIDQANITREQALEHLVSEAGIDSSYQVISLSKPVWWKKAFGTGMASPLLTGKLKLSLDKVPFQFVQQ